MRTQFQALSVGEYLRALERQQQHGEGIPLYRGSHRQRGFGLFSSIARHLTRTIIPLAKRTILPAARQMASDVFGDVTQGKKLKDSLKSRGMSQVKNIARQLMTPSTQEMDLSIKRVKRKKKLSVSKGKRRRVDVFS